MTNHFVDMANADVVMIMGSNAAANHPVTSRWIEKTKERGAVILSVDPRYTRTSAYADVYARLRSGTDIAFVGGMINYALQKDTIQKEDVTHYTNASFIVRPEFDFHDGLFSGYDPQTRQYGKSSWEFALDAHCVPHRDLTLPPPRRVFQLLKRHFSRCDGRTVCSPPCTSRQT